MTGSMASPPGVEHITGVILYPTSYSAHTFRLPVHIPSHNTAFTASLPTFLCLNFLEPGSCSVEYSYVGFKTCQQL